MTFKEWFNHPKVQENYHKQVIKSSPDLWNWMIERDFKAIFKKHNEFNRRINNDRQNINCRV